MDLDSSQSLDFNLSANLPTTCRFNVHHLSTPPTPCPALYSAPPSQSPEKTFCESHFLSVSVASANHPIQVFAVEVLIYTTEDLTTLFVSKADSTGYIHLLNLPRGTPSPFKTIASAFLAFLIENRRRPSKKLVLSLFARAQDQYLFPGSIENPHKHVLTDRGLVKWWCQVLDPILSRYLIARNGIASDSQSAKDNAVGYSSQGFLRVPGCDLYETRAFFPSEKYENPSSSGRWKASDPLRELARSETLPERCLIPRFPDDPKARFVDELDDELPTPPPETSIGPPEDQNSDRWRSVRSLEEFWEMMAFRQECSAGRLVGFLWVLIVPHKLSQSAGDVASPSQESLISTFETNGAALSTPSQAYGSDATNLEATLDSDINADGISPPLSKPPSVAEQRPLPNDLSSTQSSTVKADIKEKPSSPTLVCKTLPLREQPERTIYYYWPKTGRGAAVLREKDYRRIGKLLIQLDYADEKIAAESTERWIHEVGVSGGDPKWGIVVHGRREIPIVNNKIIGTLNASMLDIGLIKKKGKRKNDGGDEGSVRQANGTANGVNVLSLDHVRKKPKNLDDSKE